MQIAMASFHHLLALSMVGVLVFELTALDSELAPKRALRIGNVDGLYGLLAFTLFGVGFYRVLSLEKGWWYYSHNTLFWTKISTGIAIGLLSIYPTVVYMGWRKRVLAGETIRLEAAALRNLRLVVVVELALVGVMAVCAAPMARGIGTWAP